MKSKILVILILVVCVCGAIVFFLWSGLGKQDVMAVKVFEVQEGDISKSISATGVVKQNDAINITLDAGVKINSVFFEVNSSVKKGELLAEVDYKKLENQLQQQKKSFEKEMIESEDSIEQAELQIKLTGNELQIKQTEIDMLKKELDENLNLFETNAISKSELEDIKGKYELALKDLENTRLRKESEEIKYKTALNLKDKRTELNQLQIEKLNMDFKKLVESSGQIISPVDGIVSYVGVKNGEYATEGKTLFEISTKGKVHVTAKINEEDIKYIKIGNLAILKGNGFEGTIDGVVSSIAPSAHKEELENVQTTVIDVDVSVADKDSLLKPGYNVEIEINTLNKKDVLLVNRDAVKEGNNGLTYVYIVENGISKRKDVKVSITTDALAEIAEGLNKGEKVIYYTRGNIKDNAPVQIISDK